MRRVLVILAATACLVASAGTAQAAKTYSDPWLENDLAQMRVPDALDILARVPQHVIVGVVDSGARLADPDLAPHLLKMSKPFSCGSAYGPGPAYAADPARGDFGCDFIGTGTEAAATTNPDGQPADPFGHGTGATAVIAAVPNNGVGGAGVAPNARVLPVRACYGGAPDCYEEPALAGLSYAVAMGATIISGSWPPGNDYSPAFRGFVQTHPDVLFVFAIGGSDQNADPYSLCTDDATFPNVICVGLVNEDDTAGTVNADKSTDVSAPGHAGVPNAGGGRSEFGYTSGATAHVSGAAALLRGLAPSLSPKQIRDVLVTTSRKHAGYDTANQAHGIVDVAAAVKAVQSQVDLTTPSPGKGAAADSPDPFAGSSTPGSAPGQNGSPNRSRVRLKLRRHPRRVRAGHVLRTRLTIKHGPTTVRERAKRGKRVIARVRKRHAKGRVTLKLRIPRRTRPGKLRVTVTAAPVTRHFRVRVGRH